MLENVVWAPRGWLVLVMCCSVCDGVLWACLWTDCDRKQFVCWSDGSGDVEQSDEMISVSPPPARSQHPSRTKTNLNNFFFFSFCHSASLPVIYLLSLPLTLYPVQDLSRDMRPYHLSVIRLAGLSVCPFRGGPSYQHHAQWRTGKVTHTHTRGFKAAPVNVFISPAGDIRVQQISNGSGWA